MLTYINIYGVARASAHCSDASARPPYWYGDAPVTHGYKALLIQNRQTHEFLVTY